LLKCARASRIGNGTAGPASLLFDADLVLENLSIGPDSARRASISTSIAAEIANEIRRMDSTN